MYREGFPVFKGLQKPLELMGIRGRFLTLAAGAIGVSFIGFIVFSILIGKIAGFLAMIAMALIGLVTIYIKQRVVFMPNTDITALSYTTTCLLIEEER
jgi:hypothetical protein